MVESSIAVEVAVENRGFCEFSFALVLKGFRHDSVSHNFSFVLVPQGCRTL